MWCVDHGHDEQGLFIVRGMSSMQDEASYNKGRGAVQYKA